MPSTARSMPSSRAGRRRSCARPRPSTPPAPAGTIRTAGGRPGDDQGQRRPERVRHHERPSSPEGSRGQERQPGRRQLPAGGAVLLGRTNTPAFSLRWFTSNGIHGATKNPRDPSLTPGGSSGGAGAAVAAGIGAIAHGTDIAGSVRYPAYACGVTACAPASGGSRPGTRPPPSAGSARNSWRCPDRSPGRSAISASRSPPWRRPIPAIRGGSRPRSKDRSDRARRRCACGRAGSPSRRRSRRPCAMRRPGSSGRRQAGRSEEIADTPPIREANDLQLVLWLGDGYAALRAAASERAIRMRSPFSTRSARGPRPWDRKPSRRR